MSDSEVATSEWEAVALLHDVFRVPGLDDKRFRHAALWRALDRVIDATPYLQREQVGTSAEGRPLYGIRAGTGATRVLTWSQMHGNEPTGTMALADALAFIGSDAPEAAALREEITLVAIPMLNPDGAERFSRLNAQCVDLNRDARMRATPEGQCLWAVWEREQPLFGLSLHDQEPRKRVGSSTTRVAFSMCAPEHDPAAIPLGVDTRDRAMRVLSAIREPVQTLVDGRLTRFGAEFDPRGFCDNFQSRGTSCILLEAGGWDEDPEKQYLRHVYFVAFTCALNAIAKRTFETLDAGGFQTLSENADEKLQDFIVRGGMVVTADLPPFEADIAVKFTWPLEKRGSSIATVGDLSTEHGVEELDAKGLYVHMRKIEPEAEATFTIRRGESSDSEALYVVKDGVLQV